MSVRHSNSQEKTSASAEIPLPKLKILGIEAYSLKKVQDVEIIIDPIPDIPKGSQEIIDRIEEDWLREHPRAYNGPMFFPTAVTFKESSMKVELEGNYYEQGYALHCLLRDNSPEGLEIRKELEKNGINYDAGLAVSVIAETEYGPLVFRSKATEYSPSKQWQMPGGNFQHSDPFITALEETHEEIGVPREFLMSELKPMAFFWRDRTGKNGDKQLNPTLIYSFRIFKADAEKCVEFNRAKNPDKDQATEIMFVSVKKDLIDENKEFTPGAKAVMQIFKLQHGK